MAIFPDLSGNVPLNAPSSDKHISSNLSGASHEQAVVLSDTVDLPYGITIGISCDVGGVVKITYNDGSIDSPTLAGGLIHPINAKRIWSTGTTATGLRAYY